MKKFIFILALVASSFNATGADMSNGADNFCRSDKASTQEVICRAKLKVTAGAVASLKERR